jgi:hypothetical protein
LIIIPVVFIIVSFFGIATTSASKVLYGSYLWNPADIFAQWGNRAAVFFASAGFAVSIIGTNISANSISAAVDLMTLCPKYINLRRGQILAAFIGGWAFVPWNILASAIAFLEFMSGYTVLALPSVRLMVDLVGTNHIDHDCGILDHQETQSECSGIVPSTWNVPLLERNQLACASRVVRRFCSRLARSYQLHHPLNLHLGRRSTFVRVELSVCVFHRIHRVYCMQPFLACQGELP